MSIAKYVIIADAPALLKATKLSSTSSDIKLFNIPNFIKLYSPETWYANTESGNYL